MNKKENNREHVNDTYGEYRPWMNLAATVVSGAVTDCKSALKQNRTGQIKALESFFRSEWCYLLTNGLDGELIIEKIKKMVEQELKDKNNK
jgi:hypothetical protein